MLIRYRLGIVLAFIFQKVGSHKFLRGFLTTHSKIHHIVSHSLAIFLTNSIILGATFSSAVLIVLFSIILKSIFLAIYFQTCLV